MSLKKPAIPATGALPQAFAAILGPIKANIDYLTGRTTGEIVPLATTATTAQIISKVNEIIARLNAST